MIIIKRYPNRKLYNTEAKQYVTLDGIAELIREGEEIQILDHATGDDLTAVTLTQIIFEQEKKQAGFLPRSVLTGLVQSGGQTLSSLRRTLASPLDLFHQVDQEIGRRIELLVDQGEMSQEEGQEIKDKLLQVGRRPEGASVVPSEAELERVLSRRGIPSRDELEQLNARLDELVDKIDQLGQEDEAGG
jgi:polyhydroxyalkanoate synthesis repressor PhaR